MAKEEFDLSQPLETNAVSAIVVKTNKGEHTLLKDAKGKFTRKERPLPSGKEVTRAMRKLLLQLEAGPDGKITKASKNKIQQMVENMVKIATTVSDDAKTNAVAVQAFKELMLRVWGQPSKSDEDIDTQNSGIKIVIVPPPQLKHPEMVNYEDSTKLPAKPNFIDAEIVSEG